MPEDLVLEWRELVDSLSEWLHYQRRLGWRGLPPESTATTAPKVAVPAEKVFTLEEIRQEMGRCQRCKLYPGAKNLVFGEGSPSARLMFIGEAPGAEEDLQGRPFVGAAGQVLNNLLNKLGLAREEVYITNVVKSRPPENRDPEPDEIAACLPYLQMQIAAIRPRVIVTLGKIATQALLGLKEPITKLRGQWQRYGHLRVMPTFHPSYLLRLPKERHKTWEDMQRVMEYLAEQED
ncbi:MAG: uracil-DNA glycosylase [Deltaproteobacteria bacterium]|nr:uracil-DNA glycosylase [Deltaproteobacteria bacterium]